MGGGMVEREKFSFFFILVQYEKTIACLKHAMDSGNGILIKRSILRALHITADR